MNRTFAVGDIHGCVDELATLLDEVDAEASDHVVFLGDYVDRGPSARGVIDHLLRYRSAAGAPRVTFLKGNHEDMFLAYLGEEGRYGDVFLMNGGKATMTSYGIPPEARGQAARERMPVEHLEFLRALQLWAVEGTALFVHAGVSPLRQLDKQNGEDLLWIREEFIRNRHLLPYTVIFGHTPQREVLWNLPYKIGLDTGCVYGNKLSCLEFSTGTLYQVARNSTRARVRVDLPELRAVTGLIRRTAPAA
jgi:serine/threonine protein phosphatase 1